MEVIRHQHIGNQLAGPLLLLVDCVEFFEKGSTACRFSKDRESIDAVASNIVKSSGKIQVGPFSSHGEEAPLRSVVSDERLDQS